MKLATVAAIPGGAAVSPVATWPVAAPVARGYRAVLYLRVDRSGSADAIEIDESGCEFDAVFQPLDYDALHSTPQAALSLSKDGKAVIVKLDGPRRVLGVALAAPPRPVELHRADGPVQADKAADASNFTDVNFAVQFTASVATNQVVSVNVRGMPANPRLAIAGIDLASPELFWPTPGAAGSMNVSAGAAFARALRTALAAPQSEVALIVESDAPCRIAIGKLKAPYRRVLTAFTPQGGGKEVLRYSGKRVERRLLSVTLPSSATVISASLKIDESFRAGAAAATPPEILEPASAASLPDRGILLSAGRTLVAAQRVETGQANRIAAFALALMAVSPGASLAIEVQPEYQGAPSGKKIAEASVTLPQAGVRDWAIASLAAPVAIAGGACWILARAVRGDAVWLTAPGAYPVQAIEGVDGRPEPRAPLGGLEALCRPILQATPEAAQPDGDAPPPGHARAAVGAASASMMNGSLDLTAPINAYLTAARNGPAALLTEVPIAFTAAAAGLITVYSPRIVYDLP
jgi:hypothetical protein